MAKKMKTSRMALDRLLDPENISVTLHTLEKAAVILGKKIKIKFALNLKPGAVTDWQLSPEI